MVFQNDQDSSNLPGFRSRKASQVAAFFAIKADGRIDKFKLSSMLYLVERESMAKRGRPLFYDKYYALRRGPICSNALNGINNHLDSMIWSEFIGKREGSNVGLMPEVSLADLDELSRSDLRVLESVWVKFGPMTAPVIQQWIGRNCAEYIQVQAGRIPISDTSIYAALGYDAEQMATEVLTYRDFQAALEISL